MFVCISIMHVCMYTVVLRYVCTRYARGKDYPVQRPAVWGFTGAYTLHDPRAPQGLPIAPPADPGRAQDIAFRWWDPVMTYTTFHAPETSFGPHFNTFLAWVETRGHRASYEMCPWRPWPRPLGCGPISSPIHKKIIFFNFNFFEIPKLPSRSPYRGELITGLRMLGGGRTAPLC